MSAASSRVYFVTHHDGRMTGHLLRRGWSLLPPVSAYGDTREEVLQQLEVSLQDRIDQGKESLASYQWEEDFTVSRVVVSVHPQAVLRKRHVIGAQEVPLRLTYAWAKMRGEGYFVLLPRFNWWFVLEELSLAPTLIKQSVSAALLGEQARWLFEFRYEGEEFVEAWAPRLHRWRAPRAQGYESRGRFPALWSVSEELVERAGRRQLPRAVGEVRLGELERLIERDPPMSVLLVGPPGVGKTTLVRQLAYRQARRQRDAEDAGHIPRIWSTSSDRIISGMQYLGQWEQRCLDLLAELSREGDVIHVGHLHGFTRGQGGGHTSIADLFIGPMLRGEVSVIVEATPEELARAQRAHPALLSALTIVRVEAPAGDQLPALLLAYLSRLKSPITIHPAGLRRLVQHLSMFKRDAAFPGKGFVFMDWLDQQRADDDEGRAGGRMLYAPDISAAFSRYSGLPEALISEDALTTTEALAEQLGRAVIGQPRACEAAARVLTRFKAGLNDPDKPSGALCFVGPTGVGKTELAKALARAMFGDTSRLIRLDMSEYMNPGSAQRLLATGRGTSSLAARVTQQPMSLILLDEIEKAHPEVFDLLLGVLGEGRLTDLEGRLVDMRMCMIVMTSNLGVQRTATPGFGESRPDFEGAVRKHFRPELFNRIDEVVPFSPLSPDAIRRIVTLSLDEVASRVGLTQRHITLHVTPAARDWLARHGWHPTFGARPLKRLIEAHITTPLAVELSANPALRDTTLTIELPEPDAEYLSVV